MAEPNQSARAPSGGVLNTRIAISCFGEEVAPCFDTARRFRFWEIIEGNTKSYRELTVEGSEGLERVRLLKQVAAQMLICNGISEPLREILEMEGCQVIDGVIGSASDALFGFLAGKIEAQVHNHALKPEQMQPHTADLVDWTEELFQKLGWTIRRVHQDTLFPIDLTVERVCPICKKSIRAAVCCGAHAYRIEDEIRELKRVASYGYDVRVYVHHSLSGISQACREFGIELLDPLDFSDGQTWHMRPTTLPPLKEQIAGHEALNQQRRTQGTS